MPKYYKGSYVHCDHAYRFVQVIYKLYKHTRYIILLKFQQNHQYK